MVHVVGLLNSVQHYKMCRRSGPFPMARYVGPKSPLHHDPVSQLVRSHTSPSILMCKYTFLIKSNQIGKYVGPHKYLSYTYKYDNTTRNPQMKWGCMWLPRSRDDPWYRKYPFVTNLKASIHPRKESCGGQCREQVSDKRPGKVICQRRWLNMQVVAMWIIGAPGHNRREKILRPISWN